MSDNFMYPIKNNLDVDKSGNSKGSKPRVIFRSYRWETSVRPELAETKIDFVTNSTSSTTLCLPGEFSEKYGASWGNEQVFNISGEGWNTKVNLNAFEYADSLAKKFGLEGLMYTGKYVSGNTHFPGEFQVFKQGDPMQLSFAFDMIPRNSEDATVIKKIIDNFKTKILPTFTGNLLKFPEVWGIFFTGINGPGFPYNSKGVSKYLDMALVDCTVTYGGGAQSALVYADNNPVNVKLQLSFHCIKHSYLTQS
jgi:hypothetical protein